jgi:signal peptidase I
MKRIGSAPVFTNLFLVISLIAMWIFFAPTRVGGRASYVIINGNSMEPGFHRGDLVIVQTASDYGVGDIVTYNDAKLGANVIHRIIKVEQDYFILKGDNNSWIDAYHPTRAEIVGKLWIHIPKLGKTMEWLRTPVNMALITGILGGILMAGKKIQPDQHGKRKSKPSAASPGWFEMTLYTIGFLTLVFIGLSIYSFSRPITRTADDIKFEQTGIYYYSATSPVGIFDTEIIHSGDPIFTKLTCSIIIGYSYNITGPLQEVSGTQQLAARIVDEQSGWQRTIALTPATAFSGTSYSTTAPIDLCQFQSLVNTMGEETGFIPRTTLTIISQIAVTAKAGGQNLYDSFDSNLVFQFDNVHFYMAKNNGETDPLQSSKSGVIANPSMQANTFKFLGFEFKVLSLRILGIGGLILSLLSLSIFGWYFYNVTQRNPETLVRMKYGALIMDVYDRGLENISSVIEVTSIDDLAKLAERQGAMILHMTRDFLHYYFVQTNGVTYRYVSSDGHVRETNHERRETQHVIIPPSEADQSWKNESNQTNQNEHLQANAIPKKIILSYDKTDLHDEHKDSK